MSGTLALIGLALRRDRVMLPAWIAVFVLTAASSASATISLYPTVESRIAAAQLPEVWVVPAIVAMLFGLVSRLITAGWALLVGFLLLGEVGPLLKLPDSVMDLSPYAHVPRLPGGTVTAAPLLWLTLVAAGLLAAGLLGFRRRDIG